MSAPTLLEKDRRALHGHRLRGLPAFWLGFLSLILSLVGFLARQREVPELRTFGRNVLGTLPGGHEFFSGLFHIQFTAPFATIGTFVGLALLVWGWIELVQASRIKRELAAVEDARRKEQMLHELQKEQNSGPAA